jgi:translation initiation factor IF-2
MSVIGDDIVARLRKNFEKKSKEKAPPITQEQKEPMQKEQLKTEPSLVKKSQKIVPDLSIEQSIHNFDPKITEVAAPEKPLSIVVQPMTVSDVAHAMGKAVHDVILTLLKWKIIAAKNKLLPEDIVERLARHYEIAPIKKEIVLREESSPIRAEGEGFLQERLPVIVVVGHVDHGKTTLLDFIRKTRVVAKEKGGITQHLGAYEASTPQGNIVFLDTPGHEAFPKMRQRGIKVADIGVLVIAADDGIMPQTVEVIKQLKKMNIPIIVAINKIDKVDKSRIEVVKRQLAEHDLLPEEWGGQVICIPISALKGIGVDKLLEMIVLQAQLLELRASQEGFARCYVLESRLERGRGAVATLICQHGTVKIGDYFVCGNTAGRVTSIKDSYGNLLQSAIPSIPIQVAGFRELPEAGDFFKALPKNEMLQEQQKQERQSSVAARAGSENAINLIIKADTNSSKEALVDAINKLSQKSPVDFNVIYSGIGNVSESDIELAFSTNALIVGLHIKADSNAVLLAQRRSISIELHDIIYKLLEMLEARAEKEKVVETVKTKIGEAIVRRVFDIKGVGIVAGSYVQDGRFVRNGYVVAWRGSEKIGEGKVISLQRDKKMVKEVHTGYECGFVVEGITDWQEDDRAECFIDMPKK